jgi:hypothetical protein
LTACRYNGDWLPKTEGRDDIVHNGNSNLTGSYERDRLVVAADGTFELTYEFGWNHRSATTTQIITNFLEHSVYVKANPDTRFNGGRCYRKSDTSRESKIPTQTGTVMVREDEAELTYGPQSSPPFFRGWNFWQHSGPLPELMRTIDITDDAQIPADCRGDTPYTGPMS